MGIKVCALQRHLEVDPSTLLYAYYFLQTKLMMCERVVSTTKCLFQEICHHKAGVVVWWCAIKCNS
jgi:hypothetical protein